MNKIDFLTTLMVYIFIIAFLKESLKNENSYFNFRVVEKFHSDD